MMSLRMVFLITGFTDQQPARKVGFFNSLYPQVLALGDGIGLARQELAYNYRAQPTDQSDIDEVQKTKHRFICFCLDLVCIHL